MTRVVHVVVAGELGGAEQMLVDLATHPMQTGVEHAVALRTPSDALRRTLRDAGVRTPDFVVIGNGRAVLIEVDGPHHFGATRKADDHTRDRHWDRCGVRTIRIPSEHADDPASLKDLLREDLRRRLWMPGPG